MPLETMRVLVSSTASSLRFQSDNFATTSQVNGLTMNATYAFAGTNIAQAALDMCSSTYAASNCFLHGASFSSFDVDQDNYTGDCGTSYGNVGYWYDDCYSTNVFRTDVSVYFASYSKDPTTTHWTWWVK